MMKTRDYRVQVSAQNRECQVSTDNGKVTISARSTQSEKDAEDKILRLIWALEREAK